MHRAGRRARREVEVEDDIRGACGSNRCDRNGVIAIRAAERATHRYSLSVASKVALERKGFRALAYSEKEAWSLRIENAPLAGTRVLRAINDGLSELGSRRIFGAHLRAQPRTGLGRDDAKSGDNR